MARIAYTLIVLCLTMLSITAPARAGSGPVVVELFTSQGCSSCPPADAYLGELAGRDDVIALAMHVDYWDYIGWKDMFADPEYTRRQKSYARAAGHRSVYTPQFIVQGRDHVIGHKPMKLSEAIQEHKAQAGQVELQLSRKGDKVTLNAKADKAFGATMVVQVLRYSPREQVAIKRGENAGRTLSYHNVVTELRALRKWDGRAPLKTSFETRGDAPVVVIVQEPDTGTIVAAGRLR